VATSLSCGYPFWADGITVNGLLGRTNHVAASFLNAPGAVIRGGVLVSGGQLIVTAGSGMAVIVSTGYAICPSSTGSADGAYLFGLLTPGSLTVATADAVSPRVDLVTAYVVNNGDATDDSFVEILTGTPTPGATLGNLNGVPATPANGIVVGYVLVPASATSITSMDVQSNPFRTVAQGGILPVTAGLAPVGYTGMYIHDNASGRLMHNPAAGPVQPKLLPSIPQLVAGVNTTYSGGGANIIVASVSVPCDGNTDLEIHACWRGVSNAIGSAMDAVFAIFIDASQVKLCDIENRDTTGGVHGGAAMFHFTASGTDRPSAGTHTVSLQYSDDLGRPALAGPPAQSLITTSVFGGELYVRPVPL
jgi:hypothetical protein